MTRGKPSDGSKNPGGRPTLYDEKYCDEIVGYFKSFEITKKDENDPDSKPVVKAPPSLTKFAESIDVSHDTLLEWVKVHPKFSVSFNRAKKIYNDIYVDGAILGHYNAFFTKLVMFNRFEWSDKSESKNETVVSFADEIRKAHENNE